MSAVEGVFLATFHVRQGNSLSIVHPPQLTAALERAHAEWKALPSGAHAVERDLIFFLVPGSSAPEHSGSSTGDAARTAVACFRNIALARQHDGAGDGRDAGARAGLDERGARMISIGAVFGTTQGPPSPHLLRSLERTADRVALATKDADVQDGGVSAQARQLLVSWFESVQDGGHDKRTQLDEDLQDDEQADLFAYSAVSHLPALSASLGPLLPPLLKRLATGSCRLLIYSAAPLQPAASLAYNLADIVHAAQTQASVDGRGGRMATRLLVRGLVTLHDIAALEEQSGHPTSLDGASSDHSPGWIAFTSDKVLLDKCALFDVVLDLTPLQGSAREANKGGGALPSKAQAKTTAGGTKPIVSIVTHAASSSSSSAPSRRTPQLKLKPTSWSTQEYAEMRLVEDKVRRRLDSPLGNSLDEDASSGTALASPIPRAEEPALAARRITAVRNRKGGAPEQGDVTTSQPSLNPTTSRSRPTSTTSLQARSRPARGLFLSLVSLLRYVLAQTLWFFPSAFWTPDRVASSALALLGDGGASAGVGGRRRSGFGLGRGTTGALGLAGTGSETASLSAVESAFILPLGVRPDGGLRASVVLDPEDGDEEVDEAEEEDGGGDNDAQSRAGRSGETISPSTPPRARREDARLIDLDEDDDADAGQGSASGPVSSAVRRAKASDSATAVIPGSPDPFLAACGARAGSSRTASGHEARRRLSEASLRARGATGDFPSAGDTSAVLSDEEEGDPLIEQDDSAHVALATALREEWTDWLTILHLETAALLEACASSTSSASKVELDGTDLGSVGLSSRNAADCAFVRTLGRHVLDCDVVVRSGWAWTTFFR